MGGWCLEGRDFEQRVSRQMMPLFFVFVPSFCVATPLLFTDTLISRLCTAPYIPASTALGSTDYVIALKFWGHFI